MTADTKIALCVGHCTLDTIGVVDRLQPPGSKVELHQFTIQGGGPAATAGVALARLGVNTRFVGKVGDDDRGDLILRTLSEAGVDVSRVLVEPDAVSQFSFIVVERQGRRRHTYWTRGAIAPMAPSDLSDDLLDGVDILHVDGYHPEAQADLAVRAAARGVRTVFDAGQLREGVGELIAKTDVVVASERFATEFSGVGQLRSALDVLCKAGPEVAVITMGSEGSIGMSPDGLHVQPPMTLDEECDNTGAGDVYRGGFIRALLHGHTLPYAMAFATAAATLSLRTFGGRSGLPTLEEIEELLATSPVSPPHP